ncbi:uncharacterized protein V6R79_001899 [Siganus canaliculatus]
MEVVSLWGLAIPLPAVMIITVALYMIVLGIGLWIRSCVKDRCFIECGDCCPGLSICEQCYSLGEMCEHCVTYVRSCWGHVFPSSCVKCDCACTCQPPECDSCNCLCFEIRIK